MNPANQNLRSSATLIATIQDIEEFVGFTYDDAFYPPRPFRGGKPKGTLTIGFGHTAAAGSPIPVAGLTMDEAEGDRVMRRDLIPYENRVKRLVDVPLTQGQFDALVDFEFNTGHLAGSTLLKKLNAGQYDAVPAELMKWTHSGGKALDGLVKRRRKDCELWRGLDPDVKAPRVAVDRPKAKSLVKSREANAAIGVTALGSFEAVSAVSDQVSTVVDQVSRAKDAMDAVSGVLPLLMQAKVIIPLLIVLAGIAIYLWRRGRLVEDAN